MLERARHLHKCIRPFSDFSYPKSFPQSTQTVVIERHVTHDDVASFARLTGDHNPIHLTDERPIAHGALLNAFVSSVIGCLLPGPGTRVVEQLLKFPAPCFVGDTVSVRVDLPERRKLVVCFYRVTRLSDSTDVMLGKAKLILPS